MIGQLARAGWAHAMSCIAEAIRGSGKTKFAVTVVSPPGYFHSAAFSEISETIHHGLCSLGYDSVLTTDGALRGRRHNVLGSNWLSHYPLPLADDAILYNLEQVDVETHWLRPGLIEIFRRYELWDYSERNAAALEALGVKVARIVPVSYAKEMTRLQLAADPDIDVLFFGSMNARRQKIIDEMRAARLRVETAIGVYGEARDALIERSKLILNVHFYEAKVMESVRLSYLLANRCAVLSEHGCDPLEDEAFSDGVAFSDYQHLAQRARALIDAPDERKRLALRGFEIMCARQTAEYLRAALAERA